MTAIRKASNTSPIPSRILYTMFRVANLETSVAFIEDPDGYKIELIQASA